MSVGAFMTDLTGLKGLLLPLLKMAALIDAILILPTFFWSCRKPNWLFFLRNCHKTLTVVHRFVRSAELPGLSFLYALTVNPDFQKEPIKSVYLLLAYA